MNRIPTSFPVWLVSGIALASGILLTLLRVQWERENIVTTVGVYEGGPYAGLTNNYLYRDEDGESHGQAFPVLTGPRSSQFEVQYARSDPANGWIKTGLPSTPLLLLLLLDLVSAFLVLFLWHTSRKEREAHAYLARNHLTISPNRHRFPTRLPQVVLARSRPDHRPPERG
jgi:hypothetical protein